jgi:hypothetical protein
LVSQINKSCFIKLTQSFIIQMINLIFLLNIYIPSIHIIKQFFIFHEKDFWNLLRICPFLEINFFSLLKYSSIVINSLYYIYFFSRLDCNLVIVSQKTWIILEFITINIFLNFFNNTLFLILFLVGESKLWALFLDLQNFEFWFIFHWLICNY